MIFKIYKIFYNANSVIKLPQGIFQILMHLNNPVFLKLFADNFCNALDDRANAYCKQNSQEGLVICWIGEIIAKVKQCQNNSFAAMPGADENGGNFYENLLAKLEEQTKMVAIEQTLAMWKVKFKKY